MRKFESVKQAQKYLGAHAVAAAHRLHLDRDVIDLHDPAEFPEVELGAVLDDREIVSTDPHAKRTVSLARRCCR